MAYDPWHLDPRDSSILTLQEYHQSQTILDGGVSIPILLLLFKFFLKSHIRYLIIISYYRSPDTFVYDDSMLTFGGQRTSHIEWWIIYDILNSMECIGLVAYRWMLVLLLLCLRDGIQGHISSFI